MKRFVAIIMAIMLLCLTGCGGESVAAKDLDMEGIHDSMVPEVPEMVVMDETMMLNFCGIKAEQCEQAVVAVCSDGLRADEVWLIEAVDASALAELQKLAEGRLTRKGEESITYSPEQYEIVKAAKVFTSGNYLAVIVSPDCENLMDIFNQAAA